MPAHSGVSAKEYPCSGSQIPCSQITSMKDRPPRPSAERNPARLPALKARMRKRARSKSGSATRRSTHTNSASSARQPNGHADEEDQPPVDGGQDAAYHEPDELAGQEGDTVDAEGQAALLGREGVGQDGLGVREEERA